MLCEMYSTVDDHHGDTMTTESLPTGLSLLVYWPIFILTVTIVMTVSCVKVCTMYSNVLVYVCVVYVYVYV